MEARRHWASQVTLAGKNQPTSADPGSIPGWGSSPGGGLATHSSVLAGHSRRQRGLVGHSPWGHKESDTTEATCRAHHWMDGGVLY